MAFFPKLSHIDLIYIDAIQKQVSQDRFEVRLPKSSDFEQFMSNLYPFEVMCTNVLALVRVQSIPFSGTVD